MNDKLQLTEEFSAGAARLRVDVYGGEPREHVLDDLTFLNYRLADVRISPAVTLADADIAPMLMVLSQLSGDLEILDEVAPHIHGAWSFLETVPEDLKQKVRDQLAAVLKDHATTGKQPPRHVPSETLQKLMSAGVGQTVPEEYIPLLMEETRLGDTDTRSVHWQRDPDKLPIQSFKVIIIGAGFSGLCAAIRLKELGIPLRDPGKEPRRRRNLAGKRLSRLRR